MDVDDFLEMEEAMEKELEDMNEAEALAQREYSQAQAQTESQVISYENASAAESDSDDSDPFALDDDEPENAIKNNNNTHIGEEVNKENVCDFLFARPGEDIDGDVSITLPNGERYYMLVDEHKDPLNSEIYVNSESLDNVLEKPIAELLQEIEREEVERIVKEAEKKELIEKENEKENQSGTQMQTDEMEVELSPKSLRRLRKENKKKEKLEAEALKRRQQLWVDRYAPRRFIDLVSNERTNRFVLQWIKSWDHFVFNVRKPINRKTKFTARDNNENNSDRRPVKKLLLLAGPPGGGKTTLAYTIAAHAGYCPIEINASDERTGTSLKERIVAAMEIQSAFGDDRPKCLILDEIEGVANLGEGKGAVQVILDLLKTKADTNKKKLGKKLTRPLICICNDAYASVLRPLRLHESTLLVHLKPPNISSSGILVNRLKKICTEEDLQPCSGALQYLCKELDFDIRNCIHSLEWISKSSKQVTSKLVENFCAKQRDKKSDIFEALNATFGRNKNKTKSVATENSYELMRVLEKHDDFLLSAMHENLLKVKYPDPLFKTYSRTMDYICDTDILFSQIKTKQRYFLTQYTPFCGLAIKTYVKCDAGTRLSFPSDWTSYMRRQRENASILDEISVDVRYLSLWFNIFQPGNKVNIQNIIQDCRSSSLLGPPQNFGASQAEPTLLGKRKADLGLDPYGSSEKHNLLLKTVCYTFQPGYTNAVRRPVKAFELLM